MPLHAAFQYLAGTGSRHEPFCVKGHPAGKAPLHAITMPSSAPATGPQIPLTTPANSSPLASCIFCTQRRAAQHGGSPLHTTPGRWKHEAMPAPPATSQPPHYTARTRTHSPSLPEHPVSLPHTADSCIPSSPLVPIGELLAALHQGQGLQAALTAAARGGRVPSRTSPPRSHLVPSSDGVQRQQEPQLCEPAPLANGQLGSAEPGGSSGQALSSSSCSTTTTGGEWAARCGAGRVCLCSASRMELLAAHGLLDDQGGGSCQCSCHHDTI